MKSVSFLQVKIDITEVYGVVMNVTMVMKQYPCSGDYIKMAAMATDQQMTSCTAMMVLAIGGFTMFTECTAQCVCNGANGCLGVYTVFAAIGQPTAMLVEVYITPSLTHPQ